MKCLIVLALVAISVAIDYEHVLQSPGELKALFNEYSSKFARGYSATEAPLRIRLFRNDLKRVVQLNKEKTWTSGLNEFSALTHAEKWQHLGLNASAIPDVPKSAPKLSSVAIAPSIDWRAEGKVTGVKNQAGCGSCWAYAAVATVETNYAIETGRRKQFSEQEYVDCVYEGTMSRNKPRDGCDGGWYFEAWDYSKGTGRLATQAAAPYTGVDGLCDYSFKHNGLQAAMISGNDFVPRGESNVLTYLNSGAVAVAFEVTDDFFKYETGIIRDDTCTSHPNHAVTAVGYTSNAMIIKNSWGAWGMNGYYLTARGHSGCQIYDHGAAPQWTLTGEPDTDPEYVPTDDDSCDGTNADGCPCGTVRCSNGACRHAHMCGH